MYSGYAYWSVDVLIVQYKERSREANLQTYHIDMVQSYLMSFRVGRYGSIRITYLQSEYSVTKIV